MAFTPNNKFKRDYDEAFLKDPMAANLLLLLCEIADESGTVEVTEATLFLLMVARFDDVTTYQLPGGLKS